MARIRRLGILLGSTLVVLFGAQVASILRAQTPPPQIPRAPSIASYTMETRLDVGAKTISGSGTMTYINASSDSLSDVWLHLYLRAFRSRETEWMREAGGFSRGFGARPDALGDIRLTRLALNEIDLLASAAITETLMRVPLPRPLAPGMTITLDVEWTSKLPRVFARTGYGGRDNTYFMVGQWYPKFAVYDRGAWDTEAWHPNSEFFHDFGRYDVSLTMPRGYVIAATGTPVETTEAGDGWQTTRFRAESVSDFAFAASPDFRMQTARSGDTEVWLYYLPEHASAVAEYLTTAAGSLAAYSRWFGAYPHARVSVVDVPDDSPGAGGMEYPMLITGGGVGAPLEAGVLTLVVAHEMAHQWFPMQTATHEGREPWLDEGFAEYATVRYLQESGARLGAANITLSPIVLDRVQYFAAQRSPLTLPAWQYAGVQYAGAVYSKSALGLATLERVAGSERTRTAFADYVARYRWKHPTARDFRESIESSLGEQRWFFDEYAATGAFIDYAAEPISGGRAVVRRLGGVRVPVEIELRHASGRTELQQWDGQGEQWEAPARADDPFVRVRVDPARRLLAELAVTNNYAGAEYDWTAGASVGSRLAFWFQLLAQWWGLFG